MDLILTIGNISIIGFVWVQFRKVVGLDIPYEELYTPMGIHSAFS